MKWNKKKICILVAVAALLLVANICRLIGNCGIYKKQAGLIRSFLYIVLFATWGLSAYSRIIQPVTRRYLSEIAFLMVFWFVIRSLKFHIVSSELYPNITRYLWYLYYLAILFIPLLAVFVAISIGKSEKVHVYQWSAESGEYAIMVFKVTDYSIGIEILQEVETSPGLLD